jgi:hypothetical protein
MKITNMMVGALALFATAVTGSAAIMNVTVGSDGKFLQNGEPDGVLSLASNAFYSSFQNSPSVANNPSNNFNFLQGVVENWNSNRLPTLPTPVFTVESANVDSTGNGQGANTFTTVAGFDYVVFHFGNGQAGDGGGPGNDEAGWWQAWYLGGESSTFLLPQEGDLIAAATSKKGKDKAKGNPPAVGGGLQPVGGFSSARYFNGSPDNGPPTRVPDGGSTIIALGAGLLGLGGVRRLLIKG